MEMPGSKESRSAVLDGVLLGQMHDVLKGTQVKERLRQTHEGMFH